MQHLNVEIKASCSDSSSIQSILEAHQARFIGEDHQIDTYFNVPNGRLKLREGNIENHLIQYIRPNQAGPKTSEVQLYPTKQGSSLKDILVASLGVLVVVDKRRKIFFIDNVKFHLDQVKGLGQFVEIEAIDSDGSIGLDRLNEQCRAYLDLFKIQESDLITHSYSDMLLP